ncbi:hypothetical protein [Allohahella marinimesophila]|uniref:Uncharacterized protein n=1 Tax=Allohahella marinimesophila TaxID=1054972 RepID=A0ABP7NT71_9GAMM
MILSIDPGLSGGIAQLDATVIIIALHDMPTRTLKKKKEIDAAALANLMRDADVIYIEQVGSRPGQDVVSAFSFGRNLAYILGAAGALKKQDNMVRPQDWQAMFGLATGEKDKARKKQQIADKALEF